MCIRDSFASRIATGMHYALDVYVPPDRVRSQPHPDDVLSAGARMAVGMSASRGVCAWERRASVSPHVLASDTGLLTTADHCTAASLRLAVRCHRADQGAAAQRSADMQGGGQDPLPAGRSPDYMGAAIRSALPADDAWSQRIAGARRTVERVWGLDHPDRPLPEDDWALSSSDITAAVRRQRRSELARAAGCVLPCATSSRGRCLHLRCAPPARLSPVVSVLAPAPAGAARDLPLYLHCPSEVVFPILALRSGHLPADRALSARIARQPADHICAYCEEPVAPDAAAPLPPGELHWRHVQHLLLHCPCPPHPCLSLIHISEPTRPY